MKFPDLIPDPELLDKIDGVEEGLRQRKRLGVLGFLGALVSLVQVLYNSDWLGKLVEFQWGAALHDWPTLVAVLAFAFSVVLFTWAKFWLRESRRPFRYTYYVGGFRPVDEQVTEPSMTWLPIDLSERLSSRIMRLSRFDERTASDEAKARRASHLHVEGDYLIRPEPDNTGRWVLEVMPWVRVGPPGNRETLAMPVRFPLDQAEEPSTDLDQASKVRSGASDEVVGPDSLSAEQYRLLVERVYYSIATQVYKQIRVDVRRKIDLLPTRYFRAMAYYNEARDYARSNTLDAYEAARELYDDAVATYDPHWRPAPQGAVRRWLLDGQKAVFWLGSGLRRWASRGFPKLARVDVMMARAKIGYADMVLYRHILAGMAGLTMSPIFEARPVGDLAVADLDKRRMHPDVPDRCAALFDAYVTLATAYFYLGSTGDGNDAAADGDSDARRLDPRQDAIWYLNRARELDPSRAERDPKYLFVKGKLQPRIQLELRLLRRAVELDPKFEVAQFELALRTELHWRGRAGLERGTAELVVREYQQVLRINPGNISALARLGDLHWLLAPTRGRRDDRRLSRSYFVRGREYKEVRQATFVAEVDYGLARLEAEQGCFGRAYDHYSSAVSAHVADGVAHSRGGYTAQFHFFDRINDEMLKRYRRYAELVARHVATAEARDPKGRDKRIRDAVHGYALNDYGEASFRYWLRYGGDEQLQQARHALQRAWELSGKELVFSAYNLHLLELQADQFRPAIGWVDKVVRVEPEWPDGRLARRATYVEWARRARNRKSEHQSRLDLKQRELQELQAWRQGWQRPLNAERGLVGAVRGNRDRTVDVPVKALPLPRSTRSDKAIEQLDNRIGSLQVEVEKLQKKIADQEDYLRTAEREAGRSARDDVPHEWLAFLWDRHPDIRYLKPTAGELSRARMRWERELDDVHVRVLINWALVQWALAEGRGVRDASATKMQSISRLLLERLQQHFWPDDLDVLIALREMARSGRRDLSQQCNRRIRAMIWRQYNDDPQYTVATWAMLDPAFSAEDRLKMLDRLAATSRLSPSALSKLLVQALAALHSDDMDKVAERFERLDEGFRIPPDVWREVAQGLVAVGRPEIGRMAFDRAIDRSRDPELLRKLGEELTVMAREHEAVGEELDKRRAWEQSQRAFAQGIKLLQEQERHAQPA